MLQVTNFSQPECIIALQLINYATLKYVFLKGQPRPLFVYFWSFQTIQFLTANQCEKMSIQYTVP